MVKRERKRTCKNCHVFFHPDSRNTWHQEYCTKPVCQKASKAASRKKWLMKEENRDYFRGSQNVRRVQQWRKAHPGYWRRRHPEEQPLQDLLSKKTDEIPSVEIQKTSSSKQPLQDLFHPQHTVLIGLISHLTGSELQDHIALTVRRLQQLGSDILNAPKGGNHDPQAPHLRSYPKDSHPIQLGGSTSGP